VGLGTDNPVNLLHLHGAGGYPVIRLSGANYDGIYGASIRMIDSSGSLSFRAAENPVVDIDQLIITTDGSVGIGTTSPDEKLEIQWDSSVDLEFGRGTSDTDVTFLTLRSPNGTKYYVTVDNSGNLTASVTHP
jgi:hypothetical protein